MIPDRRVQLIALNSHDVLALFQGAVRVRLVPPLPDDFQVISVQGDQTSNSIELLVWSASFAVVPENAIPPRAWDRRLEMWHETP